MLLAAPLLPLLPLLLLPAPLLAWCGVSGRVPGAVLDGLDRWLLEATLATLLAPPVAPDTHQDTLPLEAVIGVPLGEGGGSIM